MDHSIIAWFLGQRERWIDGSLDHCLNLGTEIGLGAMERWFMESLFGTGEGGREGSSEHCEGSSEHYRDLGTEVGVAVREQRIIGPLCYFLIFVKILPGSLDHWIIGANWNYLHITSLYCFRVEWSFELERWTWLRKLDWNALFGCNSGINQSTIRWFSKMMITVAIFSRTRM